MQRLFGFALRCAVNDTTRDETSTKNHRGSSNDERAEGNRSPGDNGAANDTDSSATSHRSVASVADVSTQHQGAGLITHVDRSHLDATELSQLAETLCIANGPGQFPDHVAALRSDDYAIVLNPGPHAVTNFEQPDRPITHFLFRSGG